MAIYETFQSYHKVHIIYVILFSYMETLNGLNVISTRENKNIKV